MVRPVILAAALSLVVPLVATAQAPPTAQAPDAAEAPPELTMPGAQILSEIDKGNRRFDPAKPPLQGTKKAISKRLDALRKHLKGARKGLARVPVEDHDHPRYVEVTGRVDALAQALEDWTVRFATLVNDRKDYRAAIKTHASALGRLVDIDAGHAPATGQLSQALETWRAAEALGPFAKACGERFAALEDLDGIKDWLQPAKACAVAPRAQAILAPFLEQSVAAFIRENSQRYQSVIAAFAEGGSMPDLFLGQLAAFDETIGTWRQQVGAVHEALGRPVPDGLLAPLEALGKQFQAATKKVMQSNRLPSEHHAHGAVSAAIKKALKGEEANGEPVAILAVRVISPSWEIEKGSFDTPVSRWKSAIALGQVKGQPFCRLYDLRASQQHMNKGNYRPDIAVEVTGPIRIAACQR